MAEIWGAAALAVGSIGSSLIASSGSKAVAPNTVQYANVNPSTVEGSTVQGDLANQGSLESLLSQSNQFQQGQQLSNLNTALPGYSQFASNLTSTASNLAANPYAVPSSVVGQLTQYASENNIGTGATASSGFSQDNLLRSLGVNALQYGQSNLGLATSALSTLTGTAPQVSALSPLNFLTTQTQGLGTATTNAGQNQAINQGAANAAAGVTNANSASLYDGLVSAGGGTQGYGSLLQSLVTGVGSTGGAAGGGQTSYASFLANNPNSAASVGQGAATG